MNRLADIDWMQVRVAELNPDEWAALAKRVSTGLANSADAEKVEALGLMPQAMRIRQGLADHQDGILINLQAQLRLLDTGKQGRAAA